MNSRLLKLTIAVVVTLAIYFALKREPGKTLNEIHVCTWSNYYPESILKEFQEKTGVEVKLSYISSNEELFSKLRAGATGYDIIQPSDYMVRQMARLKMLKELDHSKLPHLNGLDDFFRHPQYDNDLKHSIPFTWGTTGITVNTSKVKIDPANVSWDLLLHSPDPKHTSLLDDMREVFAAVLISQGLSPNLFTPDRLELTKKRLNELKKTVLTFSSEPRPLLMSGEINIAHTYSTDGVQLAADDSRMRFFIPKEGAIVWADTFAIPATSEKVDLAYQFIDYFLNPENNLKMSRDNLLATPIKDVVSKLPENLQKDPNIYPSDSIRRKLHWLNPVDESLQKMNAIWTELKS